MTDSLVDGGLVSSQAIAHAQGVQKRGYRASTVFELLVDLDHVDEEDMAQALASMSGTSLWDGTRSEPPSKVRGVVITRIQGRRCWYATANPLDENQRGEVRFATGAQEAIPLTATRTQIANAQVDRFPEWAEVRERPGVVPDERRFREQLAAEPPNEPLARLTNVWLLLTCGAPGRRLAIHAFNPPMAAVGRPGAMHRLTSGGRTNALRVIYRLAFLGRAPVGPGVRSGHLSLMLGRDRAEDLRIDVATTRQGEALLCQRVVSYAGFDGVAGTAIAELRRAWARAESGEESEPILRSILDRATDAENVLDRVWALEMLGMLLGSTARHSEARACFEEGLALIEQHGIGGRAAAIFRVGLAQSEISDLTQRAGLLRVANAQLMAPGPGRLAVLGSRADEAESHLHVGDLESALAVSLELVAADRVMFGASSSMGAIAMAVAAEARARSGDIEGAAEMVAKLDARWCPPDEWIPPYARGVVEAAAGHHQNAVDSLRRALVLPHAHVLWVGAALATSLLALGKRNEAITVARGIDARPLDAFDERAGAELERIRQMSPYR